MCLVCAQIYASDDWSRNPRDVDCERTAGGTATLNRHQETAQRLRIVNDMVRAFGVRVKANVAGGYVMTDMKGKTVFAAGLDDLWYRLKLDFGHPIDVLAHDD